MNKGFTLIELLVVILIIGTLAGIAMPQYNRSVRRAEMAEGLTHGKTIYDSAVRYKGENYAAPTSFDQLDIAFIDANATGNTFEDVNFTYKLESNYIQVTNNKGGDYELRFLYPTINNNGVYAPIACCPGSSSLGQWICDNVGETVNSAYPNSVKTLISGCKELK